MQEKIAKLMVGFYQWNPSCEATPFAPEMPFKRDGLSSGEDLKIS